MEKKPVVVAVGELLWDMLPSGKRAGGAPVNFAYHAARLGADSFAISAVGDDALGRELVQELDKAGIRHLVSVLPYPTGRVLVALKDGIPDYTIAENVAWDHIPFTAEAEQLVRRADCVCYGSLALRHADSRKTVEKLLDAVPAGALRFFDVNLRQKYYSKDLLATLLSKANVFKLNDEEIKILRDMFRLPEGDGEACRYLLEKFHMRYIIFTAGARFSAVYGPGESSVLPTPRVPVADTVGAGDSFSGAFVYHILTGKSLKEAHEAAVKVSAFVCTCPGAWPPYGREVL